MSVLFRLLLRRLSWFPVVIYDPRQVSGPFCGLDHGRTPLVFCQLLLTLPSRTYEFESLPCIWRVPFRQLRLRFDPTTFRLACRRFLSLSRHGPSLTRRSLHLFSFSPPFREGMSLYWLPRGATGSFSSPVFGLFRHFFHPGTLAIQSPQAGFHPFVAS